MFGETVTVTYPPIVIDEFSGEAQPHDFPDLAGTTVEVVGVPLDSVRMTETPTPGRPVYATDRVTAAFPYAYPINSECTVAVESGPYKGEYEVEGNPAHHQNRFTGWGSSTTVQLIRVRG